MAAYVADETKTFANISATPAAFQLAGGLYGVTVAGTVGGGSVTLQRLSGDATTYVTVLATIQQPGYATVSLPSGTYRADIDGAEAMYVEIVSIASGG